MEVWGWTWRDMGTGGLWGMILAQTTWQIVLPLTNTGSLAEEERMDLSRGKKKEESGAFLCVVFFFFGTFQFEILVRYSRGDVRLVVVNAKTQNNIKADNVSSATYNSVSITQSHDVISIDG